MKLSRRSRFIAALVALICVLFTQFAIAAYACPGMQVAQAMDMASMPAVAMDHQMMPGCEEVDMKQPVLCHAHAQIGNQSLDKPNMPSISPSVAILLVPAINDIDVAFRPVATHVEAAWLMQPSAPPLSIQNCCFRI